MNRRLLAVAWTMPPLVYPRSIQISRLLKVLANGGWRIDVITSAPDSDEDDVRDHDLAAHYNQFYGRHLIEFADLLERKKQSVLYNRLEKPVRLLFSASHDLVLDGWRSRAGKKAAPIVRINRPDVMVTFAQPWIDHLVGLDLKARFPMLPWVAHFSDPWVDSPYIAGLSPRLLGAWRRQERAVIERADAVVFVTERTADLVMAKYPQAWRGKVHVVPHGYDQDIGRFPESPPSGEKRLKIVHTGNFFRGLREPLSFLKALRQIREQVPENLFPMVSFVGGPSEEYENYAKANGLQGIEFKGRVGYCESLACAAKADVLLLIDGDLDKNVFLPSKTVDYLMQGRPILALTSLASGTSDALRPLGHDCIDPGDVDAIAAAIFRLIQQKAASGSAPVHAIPAAFDIRNIGPRFEAAMESAIQNRNSP